MKKTKQIIAVSILFFILVFTSACGGASQSASSGSGESSGYSKAAEAPYTTSIFLDEPFYEGTVTNAEEAETAIYHVMDKIGGDESTEIVFQDEIGNDEDTTIYTFAQACGGLQVHGSSVKLIADKDGQAIGLISSLKAGITIRPGMEWEITKEEAEEIVAKDHLEEGERVLPGATEETILPTGEMPEEDQPEVMYVWLVYSTNLDPEVDRAYLAHYVTGSGEYLYSIPVTEPGNSEALSGSVSTFAFSGFDSAEWTGVVTDIDGTEREITVPLMIDPETGVQYLGDIERKILCADYSEFNNHDTLTIRTSEDGTFNNNELITYETFIRVYDFYNTIGWEGPDRSGTPSLLLMNLVDENGEPVNNAFYSGKQQGFHVFAFNDEYGEGGCVDIVGHEFTHCVTMTAMLYSHYKNDYGAINEGMSDVMGNLIEIMLEDSPQGEWVHSEKMEGGPIRSLKDPNAYQQPESVWGRYYVPGVTETTDQNDNGGVHTNSSLLNLISWKLNAAGMPVEDQFYFWMNVAMVTSPETDYPLMTRLLPWCMKMTGYSAYLDALNKAIEETNLTQVTIPDKPDEDNGMFAFYVPANEAAEKGYITYLSFVPVVDGEEGPFITWTAYDSDHGAAVLKEGDYVVAVFFLNPENNTLYRLIVTPDGLEESEETITEILEGTDEERKERIIYHLDSGDVIPFDFSDLDLGFLEMVS